LRSTIRAPKTLISNACVGGTIVPKVDLSFVKTGTIMKDVWRVCRETAERETERLGSLKTEDIVKEAWRVCRETAGRETERLSSLRKGKIVKEVCRVCRETTELQTESLCPDCARIKAQIRLRFPDAVRRTTATSGECERSGCLCAACSRGTIGYHPFYVSNPTRADRETHLHPRCHELWLEP
jgi:hypothetical protein